MRIKKSLGQHFLQDQRLSTQIVSLLTQESTARTVLEVGPGKGSLTDELVQRCIPNLYLVELDAELIPYLRHRYPSLGNRILEADFLTLPLAERFSGNQLTIIGNFPYNISSQIYFKILDHRDSVVEVIGMVQKEVAERFCAQPGGKIYGIPSVLLQAFYTVEYCFTVPPHVFLPPPKVESAVVAMRRNGVQKLPCNEDLFFKVVRAGFQQRRKKLRNALHAFLHPDNPCPDLLERRAETLSVAEFIALTNALEQRSSSFTGAS
ncbi:MAG TPA: 16S rRNA (adenine(1518)-N(6)/adenine(1519)-N(6))-dimethyltransferase RsmA [Amoebophilaceae bacterium]|jgi:16S rRNA (adenine1518-N6/adenine1519-N6)-dimethyltransferase|nr:16S rRNA (adenine(1518)-N(6)/adenine(1519)-N(6))-dimethyltransferase RsmA [Amoebophilaceae bacterium]